MLACSLVITMGLPVHASEENGVNTNCIDTRPRDMKVSELVKIYETKFKDTTKVKNAGQQSNNKGSNTISDKLRIFEPKAENLIKQEPIDVNLSLLRVACAMRNLGYTVETIKVDSLVTDKNGRTIINDGKAKTESKDAIRFSKYGTTFATFTLDGNAPADHDLWKWSGCEDKSWAIVDFYLDLVGFNNYKYEKYSEKVVSMSDEIRTLITVKNCSDHSARFSLCFVENVFNEMLRFPEGKMLIYSIFLNSSLVAKCDPKELFTKFEKKNFESLSDWVKNKCKQNIEISYKPTRCLEIVGGDTEFLKKSTNFEASGKTKCVSLEDVSIIFLNWEDRYDDSDSLYKRFPDNYEGAKFLNGFNKDYESMLGLFHELCHYLTLNGRNEQIYKKRFYNTTHKFNSELIVKYLEEFFNIPKNHIYSKNEIMALLNEFIKYDNLDEVLAICWNNRGKNYFGNNIYTNLLSFRITGFIRGGHNNFYIPSLNSISLRSPKFELTTSYHDILQRNCINQMRLFRYENPELLPIRYSANLKNPFDLQLLRLSMNSHGFRYDFEMFGLEHLNRDKSTQRDLLEPFIELFHLKKDIKRDNSDKKTAIKILNEGLSMQNDTCFKCFELHRSLEKSFGKMDLYEFDNTMFITFLENTLRESSALLEGDATTPYSKKFVEKYLYKIRNIGYL